MHRDAPRITCPRLIKPNQPTPTQRGTKLASRMHCQNSSYLAHPTLARRPRSSSTVHAGNGRARDWKDTRPALTKASALGPAIQHTISKCQSLWPPPITRLWPHRHCGGYVVLCWMNNQSETRSPQRFCSSVAFVASVVFNF